MSVDLNTREEKLVVLYYYVPQIISAIIATALFALGGTVHIVLIRKLHVAFFVPFIIGCFRKFTTIFEPLPILRLTMLPVESIGYIGRILGHSDPTSLGPYVIQSLLILIAPAFFAASLYMIVGRIIALIDVAKHSVIRLKWLTKIFVIGDCISFLVQALGGGVAAAGKSPSTLALGNNLIIVGLALQIAFFGVFVVSAAIFHMRIKESPTAFSSRASFPLRRHMLVLYVTGGMIFVRSVFRIIEYVVGNDGWILQHEVMLYIFDTLLMIAVVGIVAGYHPGRLLKGLERDEMGVTLKNIPQYTK